jgi:alkanesulfonate monooxygenase SsuD/methylene tetrahydromethanopterin reductase-like flavin-dependent oxidoreductase (luciferase family)
MRLLWTQPIVDFEGRFHRLDGVGINPRPVRNIPILIGSGASDAVLRRVVRKADGWMPLLIPGLDAVDLATGVARLRQLAADDGRDPASLPIHGRVYLGAGWERQLEQAVELGFSDCSIGFNRLAFPGRSQAEHLESILEAKPAVDRIAGTS